MTDSENPTFVVTEIFKSIQGESTWAGLPCTFIRLTGCPLRCTYCDTEYAFSGGKKMSLGEILNVVREKSCRLVEITGGEPLAQPGCPVLAQALLDEGCTVLVETSGALPINHLPEKAIKIMDLKCPGSGESEKNDWSNIEHLSAQDEVKFVIQDREDFDWTVEVIKRFDLDQKCNAVLLSPVLGQIESRELSGWLLQSGVKARIQLQLHKYIWPPETRGV